MKRIWNYWFQYYRIMSNQSFYEEFVNQITDKDKKPIGSIAFEFFSKFSHFNNFIFVEGMPDSEFYSIVLRDKLINKKLTFIACNGKSNVLKAHNYFEKNNRTIIKEKHYIVDKDYTGLTLQKYLADSKKISVTKYYSLENYFFESYNFDKVLNECGFPDLQKKAIMEKLNKFLEEIIDYETIVSMNTNNEIKEHIIGISNLEDYVIVDKDNQIVVQDSLKNKVNKIISSFNKKKKVKFKIRKKTLVSNYLDIRGHDLEMFFDKILIIYEKSRKFNELLSQKDLVTKMKIDIDFK